MYSLIALILLLFLAAPVFSQSPPGPPPVDRSANTDRIRQQDMSNREWQLRNFGKEFGKPTDKRRVEALMEQTEEDFTRILTLHNEIARVLASNKALNYEFVSDATAEIKKRATRVQSTLALGLSEQEAAAAAKPDEGENAQLKDSLIKLCHQIRSFVTNPTIANPSTIDAQQLTKARYDLESVIQISGQIKKDADKLSKTKQ
jgi:hypothetical protein